ncbi:MAG: hypothetical protein K8L99_30950 [Anaerolineae bacterium]|nr:hypothetical protein [Anaerolineae bacterium]
MKIWKIKSDLAYETHLVFDKEKDVDATTGMREGKSLKSDWKPVRFVMYRDGERVKDDPSKLSDFPWLPGFFICSEHARNVLEPLVKDAVEFLPILCDAGQFYLINVTNVRPCFDYQRSEYTLFKSGDINLIKKYAFDIACVEGQDIFKTKFPLGRIFASDTFKALVEDHKLKGLLFKQVWEHPVSDDGA